MLSELDHDTRQIAQAMGLLWTFRTRSAILNGLRLLGYKRDDGQPFTLEDIRLGLEKLKKKGWAVDSPEREGLVRLTDELRGPLYADLLSATMAVDLQQALYKLDGFRPEEGLERWTLYDRGATAAIFRLAMFSGTPTDKLQQMAENIGRAMNWDEVLAEAAFAAFDGTLLKRVAPEWRWEMVANAISRLCSAWHAPSLPLAEWALAELESGSGDLPDYLLGGLVEMLIHRGETDRAQALLACLDNGTADALRACLLAQRGRHAEAQAAFEGAAKRRQAEISVRKRLFPSSIAWFYPLSLLALQSPVHLETARKFCLGEAGERAPDPYSGWGRWVHAIGARLGETALDKAAFAPLPPRGHPDLEDLWRLLLTAWLGADTVGIGPGRDYSPQQVDEMADSLRPALRGCRFAWLESQVDAAVAVLHGHESPLPFFIARRSEAWRQVLLSLQALGAEPEGAEAGEASRLLWAIRIDPRGALEDIEVFEQKRGSRGWSKPRPTSLAKVARDEKPSSHDALVARAIRPDRNQARRFTLDRANAIAALVGHPALVLTNAPEQFVDLVESQPEIEVIRDSDDFLVRVTPPLRPERDNGEGDDLSADEVREQEALRTITLVQDSPQRIRLIRFTAAQRRAAQLLGEGLRIPADAQEELQKTLRALAGHFQVQGDEARAARQVPADSRLRAELSPVGEDLLLHLVVAPLGPEGPRLAPGQGRSRLMAAIAGETVGTRRDLPAERTHLESVLEAFDFLDEPEEGTNSYEWVVTDPVMALTMVERLPKLPAIASVDWPKGQRLRVVTVDRPQLNVSISGQRDWFKVGGQATLDEGVVLKLNELLEAARSGKRFVPIGEGVYAALTRSLRQRLGDLDALAEDDKEGIRLPRLASAWVDDALEGVAVQTDAEFQASLEKLRAAQEQAIKLPRGLRAELRPYQEDGFQWAMRLAAAGFGACLADDMGLGKTLQALAILLARSKGGPALILVPTSVAGNWQREAERFAPGLHVRVYGEGNREEALSGIGPGDAVIASYTLFQMAQESFTALPWHTVIADEAQAIKNAEAKRSQAVFELPTDFRLALSGTPVENRLAELWSIMHFTNPGLLGSLSHFNQHFATPIEKNGDRQAQQRLRRLIAPFILRRTKVQVLQELPPRTEQVLSISPGENEAAHYESLRREAMEEATRALAAGPGQARLNVLAQLTRLRRAACDPRLATPEFELEGAKVQAFADLAGELSANGHKALVFSQFVDFLNLLQAPLDTAGIPYQYLDGSTPAAERTRRVAAFQSGEGDLFLISLKAGGFGLNLTAADYVVITDPWWNPAAEDQAMGRAHRMGQKRPVTVYRMVTRGTVEERIVELHQDKRALAESVLAEGEAATPPSMEDLVALIQGTMG